VGWVDTLCVDQGNDLEKGTQVQRMGGIFKEAAEVLVWQGNNEGIANLVGWTGEPQSTLHKALYYIPMRKTLWRLQKAARILLSIHIGCVRGTSELFI
jgi:hypothetical protein